MDAFAVNATLGSAPNPLSYAQKPRLPRRRLLLLVALTLVVCGSFTGWRWGTMWWRRAEHALGWWECENLVLPPDLVVYEEEWGASSRLLKMREYHSPRRLLFDPPWYPTQPAGFVPPSLYVPTPYSRLGCDGTDSAIAFVHRLTTPHHVMRLVSVHVLIGAIAPEHDVLLIGMNYTRGADGTPRFAKRGLDGGKDCFLKLTRGARLRVYAGQLDSGDPSHFTVRYSINGKDGIVDGWLRDRATEKDPPWQRDKHEWIEFSIRDEPPAEN